MAKNRGISAAHTCIPQYREYPPPPGEQHSSVCFVNVMFTQFRREHNIAY